MKRNILSILFIGVIAGIILAGILIPSAGKAVKTASGPTISAPAVPGDDEAIFYENTNYGGTSFTASVGGDITDMRNISGVNWNDKVSSIKLGKNVCVMAYQDINYKGGAWWFPGNGLCTRNIPNLVDFGWNDKMSSIQMKSKDACGGAEPGDNEVIFYEHKNFQGASKTATFDSDVADMRYWDGNWNDRVSSMKIGSNVCVTVWQNINYGGEKMEMSGNSDCVTDYLNLVNNGWNDKMSSFKVRSRDVGCSKQ